MDAGCAQKRKATHDAHSIYYSNHPPCPAWPHQVRLMTAATAEQKAEFKARYNRLKAKGLCTKCGAKQAYKGLILCVDCRAKSNIKALAGYHARKTPELLAQKRADSEARKALNVRNGVCIRCARAEAFHRFKMCAECLDKSRQDANRRNAPKRLLPGYLERKRIKALNRYYAKKAAGLCPMCGKRRPDSSLGRVCCDVCLAKLRLKKEAINAPYQFWKKANGLCRYCETPAMPDKKLCRAHWLKAAEVCRRVAKMRTEKQIANWKLFGRGVYASWACRME